MSDDKRVKEVAERLEKRLKELDMTATELSKKTGLNQSVISYIKAGKSTDMRFDVADKLSRALRVSIYWLMNGETERPSADVIEDKRCAEIGIYKPVVIANGVTVQKTNDPLRRYPIELFGKSDPKNCRIFMISGNDASPLVRDGDTVLCDCVQEPIKSGCWYALFSPLSGVQARTLFLSGESVISHAEDPHVEDVIYNTISSVPLLGRIILAEKRVH